MTSEEHSFIQTSYVNLEEHVWFRALALGLPTKKVLLHDSEGARVLSRALALGHSSICGSFT